MIMKIDVVHSATLVSLSDLSIVVRVLSKGNLKEGGFLINLHCMNNHTL